MDTVEIEKHLVVWKIVSRLSFFQEADSRNLWRPLAVSAGKRDFQSAISGNCAGRQTDCLFRRLVHREIYAFGEDLLFTAADFQHGVPPSYRDLQVKLYVDGYVFDRIGERCSGGSITASDFIFSGAAAGISRFKAKGDFR